MSIFEEFRGFWGTVAELTERAKVLSKAMGLKSEKLSERMIRYYAAEGVLDKPDRLGREAAYHFRHLLQLLNARRLVDEGVTLGVISKFNLSKSTEELEKALLKPSKDEAKAVTEMYREVAVGPKDFSVDRTHADAMKDVLINIEMMKQNIAQESEELQKNRYQIESLIKHLNEMQYEFYKRMECEQAEMRHMVMSTLERMTQMVERQRMEFEEHMTVLKKQSSVAQEELLYLLSKHNEQRQLAK